MRIAYGVHGYGRGHVTRSMATLTELAKEHELLVIGGGTAEEMLGDRFPFFPMPTAGFKYRKNATKPSFWLTFFLTLPNAIDAWFGGKEHRKLAIALQEFDPDVVISDGEGWAHHVARRMKIPRIAFDHFGVMANTRPALSPLDQVVRLRDIVIYRLCAGFPQRSLISSFYAPPLCSPDVKVIPPLLRDEVFDVSSSDGEHILVYFNNGSHTFTKELENEFNACGIPMKVYGTGREACTQDNLEFKEPSNEGFLADLASCKAVISTAGNQLIGETLYFQKPVLVAPEGCVEQRMNANALAHLGVGEALINVPLTRARILDFLERRESFKPALVQYGSDGRKEAIAILNEWFLEFQETKSKIPAHQPMA